ncbi:hypothetical protein AB0J80_32070 [Actinoplanes sp. NPDC049548]|uniref:cupin domain-containing protein n=1 Tax=Actinoplanes sp. NPDC049548 TaxID=3155152 RepID=UPI00342C52D8
MTPSRQSATFGPAHWTPAQEKGAWLKELVTSGDGGSFTLLRLDRGAETEVIGPGDGRILVLEGEITVSGTGERHLTGAYVSLPDSPGRVTAPDQAALVLVLRGHRLGSATADVFSPDGWTQSSPGLWFRLLLDVAFGEDFDERIVGVSYIEPGSSAPRHPHATAHRFLFLEGEADDEMVFPDGTRQTAHRVKGDFVDYPFPIQHQTFSRTGCTILFVHEPTTVR